MEKNWLELEDKVVVVTGGASGIGKAVVEEFLRNGAYVIICDMSPQELAIEPEVLQKQCRYIQTDVTNGNHVRSMVQTVLNEFGKIDVLVNNAGINIPRLLVDDKQAYSEFELDEIIWDKILNVNLKGVFFCSQVVAREMIRQEKGVIINMSSESGLEGSEGQSVYAASKNAVNSLTRSWAKELGKHHIRVVGIAPGILEATGLRTISYETALAYTRGISIEELRAGYEKTSTTPLGRSGRLEEVANLVCYMASERASYIHGVTYNVAGGKTRG